MPALNETDAPLMQPEKEPYSPRLHSLRTVKLFDGLEPGIAEDFARAASWRRYLPDEMVFDHGSDSLEVHFIVSGRVRLLSVLDTGETVTLAEVTANDTFGELAAIDGLPRSARAVATDDSLIASIEGPVFVELLQRHPETAVRVLRRMTCIIRSMDVRLANMSSLEPAQRVMVELIRIAEPDPRVPGTWIIPFAPSHSDIAGWASVDKERVAITIGELARDGVLRRRSGTIVFLDWPKLQMLVKPRTGRDWEDRPRGARDPEELAEMLAPEGHPAEG